MQARSGLPLPAPPPPPPRPPWLHTATPALIRFGQAVSALALGHPSGPHPRSSMHLPSQCLPRSSAKVLRLCPCRHSTCRLLGSLLWLLPSRWSTCASLPVTSLPHAWHLYPSLNRTCCRIAFHATLLVFSARVFCLSVPLGWWRGAITLGGLCIGGLLGMSCPHCCPLAGALCCLGKPCLQDGAALGA